MNLRQNPSRRAFTLIEVLVALTIFSLVLSLLYGSWRILLQSTSAGLRLAATAQRSRMTLQVLEEALNSSVFFSANARHYAFLTDASGGFSSLSFVAHLAPSFPGSGHYDGESVRRVTFTVEPDETGSAALFLRQNSILDQVNDSPNTFPVLLARDVTSFDVGYWDTRKSDFVPEWKLSNSLPALVRVSIGFGHKNRFSQTPGEVVARIVRIPSAGVASEAQTGTPIPQQ